MTQATLILTDSGGIQEEAQALGKPVLLMRDVTERPESVAAGCVKLVGTTSETIVSEVCALLDDCELLARMSRPSELYGDGTAAIKIVDVIFAWAKRTGKCPRK